MNAWAVIVAAGRGARAGFEENKVFQPLGKQTVLEKCLTVFFESGLFQGAVLVISPEDAVRVSALQLPKLVKKVAYGGKTRQESVYNGLKSVPEAVELVAVHDAARPFVTEEIIRTTLESAREEGSGVISLPVTDTVKRVSADGTVETPDRRTLFTVQTPQTFRRKELMEAHQRARQDGMEATDDAALYEEYFGNLRLVTCESAAQNRKLTYRRDFAMERNAMFRVGHGYDAHRLVTGRKLILCGEEIDWEKGLDGHSDADVAVHALMDALLGAAAMGDIGRHFPDSDDAYKGISSMKLLKIVVEKLSGAGWQASNVDVTIIAQKPKLAARIPQMQKNIAQILGLPEDCVNVKATTTERMGFEGAGEGISAHAVAMLTNQR